MFSEAQWEDIAMEELAEHGWQPVRGSEIAPGTELGRTAWDDLLIRPRLAVALRRLNPGVPPEYLDQALAEVCSAQSQDPLAENYRIHRILVDGYRGITYLDGDGIEQNPTIWFVSPRVEDNDFLAVRQVTIRSRDVERRFDIVLYLNGMPVVIVELKKASSATADLAAAHAQLTTYLREFPLAFQFCVLTAISDGITATYGTPFTELNHYAPWNVDDDGHPLAIGEEVLDTGAVLAIENLIAGICNQERFLQLLHNFVAFDHTSKGFAKRVAKPHQYFAVTKAVGQTINAVESNGKAGVVWHTQGSGKSMEMELYAHLAASKPKLKNPTFVVVTDRTELDEQLFETFKRSLLLDENPVRITTRDHLRDELTQRNTGGILFTTLQKFGRTKDERDNGLDHPLLSARRNIIVIVDEAHRSHYDDLDGYARHIRNALPNAAFIAFTGTPIAFADRNTREVFGDVIDTYDLTRAVADGATVPVYFEPRLISVALSGDVTEEELDAAADEATLGLDDTERARVEKSVAVINAVYGAPERLKELASDIVTHWEKRSAAMKPFVANDGDLAPGKALIVGATRKICATLYEEIIALRPQWHDDAIDQGAIKVVYSGSAADTGLIAKHVRRKSAIDVIQARLKSAQDSLQIVIVKDMMLTGFDAPPLHTLYLDRPLKGALLMQTLARANRTFRDKPDGLLVAYAPLIDNLHRALAEYTATDRETKPVGRDVDEAATLARGLVAAIDALCAGYDWRSRITTEDRSWIKAAAGLTNYLRAPSSAAPTPDPSSGESQTPAATFRKLAGQLARAWSLAAGSDTLEDLRRPISFYEEVRAWMAKFDAQERQAAGLPVPEDIERTLSVLVDESTAAGDIIDIYAAAGIPKPTLSDLGPAYTHEAIRSDRVHLAIESLRNLLMEESDRLTRNNLVRQRAFSERIKELMAKYTNQQLTAAEIIAELVEMAQDVAAESHRGEQFAPPLSDDELAFYDAVAANESAVTVQGEDVLAQIARELVSVMRRDIKTDWTIRDDVRAKLRSSIKRLLVKYKYPPDKQLGAISLVIEQMEAMAPRYAKDA